MVFYHDREPRFIASCVRALHGAGASFWGQANPSQLIIYFSTTSNIVRRSVVNFKDAGLCVFYYKLAHSFQFTFNYEKSTRWQQTWIRAKVIKYWASLRQYEEHCPLSGGGTVSANLRMSVCCCYCCCWWLWDILFSRSPTGNWQKFNCVSYIHWVAQLAPTFCTFQRMPSQSGTSTKSLWPRKENVFTIIVIHNCLHNTKRESNSIRSLSFCIPCNKVGNINYTQLYSHYNQLTL